MQLKGKEALAARTLAITLVVATVSVAAVACERYAGTVTLLKIRDTEGNCERWVAVLTGGLGAIPGGTSALVKYGGEAIASFSSTLNGEGCATPAHASGTPRENKE